MSPRSTIFPDLNYLATGKAPGRMGSARTVTGYERLPGLKPYPPSPRTGTRTRHDACLIRPERSLNLQEIMNGALDGPSEDKYKRLLAKNKMTAEQAANARKRWSVSSKSAAFIGLTRQATMAKKMAASLPGHQPTPLLSPSRAAAFATTSRSLS